MLVQYKMFLFIRGIGQRFFYRFNILNEPQNGPFNW